MAYLLSFLLQMLLLLVLGIGKVYAFCLYQLVFFNLERIRLGLRHYSQMGLMILSSEK